MRQQREFVKAPKKDKEIAVPARTPSSNCQSKQCAYAFQAKWVEEIRTAFSHRRDSVMTLAKVVWTAKRKLPFGQWTPLWRSGAIPFSKRKGEMLVVIWKGLGSLNAQSSAHLPASWSTLYLLAQFDSQVLLELIGQGKIHPALTMREARKLLPAVTTRHGPGRSQLQRRLSASKGFVHSMLQNWTADEQNVVQDQLVQLAREIASSGAVLQASPYHPPASLNDHHSPAVSIYAL